MYDTGRRATRSGALRPRPTHGNVSSRGRRTVKGGREPTASKGEGSTVVTTVGDIVPALQYPRVIVPAQRAGEDCGPSSQVDASQSTQLDTKIRRGGKTGRDLQGWRLREFQGWWVGPTKTIYKTKEYEGRGTIASKREERERASSVGAAIAQGCDDPTSDWDPGLRPRTRLRAQRDSNAPAGYEGSPARALLPAEQQ